MIRKAERVKRAGPKTCLKWPEPKSSAQKLRPTWRTRPRRLRVRTNQTLRSYISASDVNMRGASTSLRQRRIGAQCADLNQVQTNRLHSPSHCLDKVSELVVWHFARRPPKWEDPFMTHQWTTLQNSARTIPSFIQVPRTTVRYDRAPKVDLGMESKSQIEILPRIIAGGATDWIKRHRQ